MVVPPPLNVRLILLQVLIVVLAPLSFLKLSHYLNRPNEIMFSSPSAIAIKQDTDNVVDLKIDWMAMVGNQLLFLAFFVQHIVMAKIKFKLAGWKVWQNYPVYERIIYNIVSSILLLLVLEYQNPQTQLLFTISPWISYPLYLIGMSLFIVSNIQMEQSILIPYKFTELFGQKQVQVKKNDYEKVQEDGITIKGAYSLVRHPMQGGTILLLTFGSTIFTVEKVYILISIILFIIFAVRMEQQRLMKKHKSYQSYMQIVKHRFIPYLI